MEWSGGEAALSLRLGSLFADLFKIEQHGTWLSKKTGLGGGGKERERERELKENNTDKFFSMQNYDDDDDGKEEEGRRKERRKKFC